MPAALPAPAARQAKKSFWEAAARHQNQHSVDAYVIGNTIYRPLRRSGYLAALKINVSGQIGVTAGTAGDADAFTNILPFIGIKSPQGTYLVSTNSRDLFDFGYRLFKGTSPAGDPSYAPMTNTTSTQTINYNFYLPIAINEGLNVESGLLMRQIANNDFMLEMKCAAASDLGPTGAFALAAAGSGVNVTVEEIWFEAVNEALVQAPAFNNFCRLRSQLALAPLVAGSQNIVNYPVGPVLLDAQYRITENAVAAHANVASIGLLANFNNQLQLRNQDQVRLDNYLKYGKAYRTGILLQEFVDDSSGANESRMRDIINSAAAAQLDLIVNTKAAFNTTNSSVNMLYRELVPLALY